MDYRILMMTPNDGSPENFIRSGNYNLWYRCHQHRCQLQTRWVTDR